MPNYAPETPPEVQKALDKATATHIKVYGKTGADATAPEEEDLEDEPIEEEVEETPPPAEDIETPPPPEGGESEVEKLRKDLANEKAARELAEHKYRTIQGKYDVEVPDLHRKVRELETAPPAPPPTEETIEAVNEEDFEDYGPEVKALAGTVNKLVKKLSDSETTIKRLTSDVGATVQKTQLTEAERFWGTLDSQVPDWKPLNDSPKFHEWLGQIDPFTGVERQALLRDAQRKLDPVRVASFFKLFKKEAGIKDTVPDRHKSLERQVDLPRRRSGAPPASVSQGKTYTRKEWDAELKNLDKKKQQGHITAQVFEKRFKELHAAMQGGRVT